VIERGTQQEIVRRAQWRHGPCARLRTSFSSTAFNYMRALQVQL
jgi:hypothetical protein